METTELHWRQPFYIQKTLLTILVALLVYGLKRHYAFANGDDLFWILAPTARLVEALAGIAFHRASGLGWANDGHTVIIAPSCSGVNFLCLLVGLMSLQLIFSKLSLRRIMVLLPVLAGAAYLITLMVNGARIWLSIALYEGAFHTSWLSAADVHRIAGVALYYLALLSVCLILSALFDKSAKKRRSSWPRPVLFLLPLSGYLIFVLGIPALRHLSQGPAPGFYRHGLMVMTVSAGVTGFLFVMIAIIQYAVTDDQP